VEQWEVHRQNQDIAGSTETVLREAEGNLPQNGNFTNKEERTLTEL
jgi:hypothetical protein